MPWVCTDCDRTYHDPPESDCHACGGSVVPVGTDANASATDRAVSRMRDALFGTGSHSLTDEGPGVRLLFRILLAVTFLLLGYAFGSLLLGLV